MQDEIEQELLRLFPPDRTETIFAPTLVIDCNGVILLWFLPGLLNSQRKVKSISVPSEINKVLTWKKEHMWQSLTILEKRLKVKPNSTSWRVNGDHYRPATECRFKPGSLSFGLAWYQQAQQV